MMRIKQVIVGLIALGVAFVGYLSYSILTLHPAEDPGRKSAAFEFIQAIDQGDFARAYEHMSPQAQAVISVAELEQNGQDYYALRQHFQSAGLASDEGLVVPIVVFPYQGREARIFVVLMETDEGQWQVASLT